VSFAFSDLQIVRSNQAVQSSVSVSDFVSTRGTRRKAKFVAFYSTEKATPAASKRRKSFWDALAHRQEDTLKLVSPPPTLLPGVFRWIGFHLCLSNYTSFTAQQKKRLSRTEGQRWVNGSRSIDGVKTIVWLGTPLLERSCKTCMRHTKKLFCFSVWLFVIIEIIFWLPPFGLYIKSVTLRHTKILQNLQKMPIEK
jgi:hypothetical protein